MALVTATVVAVATIELFNPLSQLIHLADRLQSLHADSVDLRHQAAGRARHLDARPPLDAVVPAGVVARRARQRVCRIGITLDRAVQMGTMLDAGTAQVREVLPYPLPVADLSKGARNAAVSGARDLRCQRASQRHAGSVLPVIAALPAEISAGVYVRLRLDRPPALHLPASQDGAPCRR